MQNLVVEVLLHEAIDTVVQCCAEEHALSGLRGLVHDAGDNGKEAEIGHVVGLVEDGDLDGIQLHEALFHKVFEATGAGHDDVDTGFESRDLALLRDAAEDSDRLESVDIRERGERDSDLGGEFPGRSENERKRATRAALATGE